MLVVALNYGHLLLLPATRLQREILAEILARCNLSKQTESYTIHTILYLDRRILVTSKAAFACGGTEPPVICSFSPLSACSARCVQQVVSRSNLSQQREIYAKPYTLAVWRGCFRTHGHLRLLKIWKASRIFVPSLCRGHSNLLCIVRILIYVLP